MDITNELLTLQEHLSGIETRGENTIKMANALVFISKVIDKIQNEKKDVEFEYRADTSNVEF